MHLGQFDEEFTNPLWFPIGGPQRLASYQLARFGAEDLGVRSVAVFYLDAGSVNYSRDYAEQRNQSVILVPDCGRRMRALDGELSQFDHCLNAMLLIAYIALRQGDEVGVAGFGGIPRWLKPVRGLPAMPTLLNSLRA